MQLHEKQMSNETQPLYITAAYDCSNWSALRPLAHLVFRNQILTGKYHNTQENQFPRIVSVKLVSFSGHID